MEHTERRKKRRSRGIYTVLGIALSALALVAIGGVYYYNQAEQAKRQLHNTYMRAFHDMSDYLNDIDISLKKVVLTQDVTQLSTLSSQLHMQAEGAKACLAQMPVENASFDNTSKFLSQVGDYCSYLSRKAMHQQEITEEEYQNLHDLSQYAESVHEEFSNMETAMQEGNMQIETLSASSPFVVHAANGFQNGMEQIESLPQEYPALIYDGPFSDHLETAEPVALMGKPRISRHRAEQITAIFLGEEKASRLHFSGDGTGKIETYLFEGKEGNRDISMEVTKRGGEVLWMLDAREVKESRLSVHQAMAAGETFLSQRGYLSMKSSYYDVADNIATINYAYFDADTETVMYPDLVKVKIALDNGEVVGFESQGYQMSHKIRELTAPSIGEDAAKEKVSSRLSVDTVSKAVIPLESGREVLCYELKGTLGKNNFLIYVNAQTGEEEKILMLLESENGILTI